MTPTTSKYRLPIPPSLTWKVAHSISVPEPDASGNYQDPLGLSERTIVAFSSHFESTSGTKSHNEGGSQTGIAWLRLQRSIYMAESMNKDRLSHLLLLNVTESGGWMHLPHFSTAAPACCVSHSSYKTGLSPEFYTFLFIL